MSAKPSNATDLSSQPTAASCPHSIGHNFNLLASPHLENPYPFFAQARAEEPVFFNSALNVWMITRYDDICWALKNYECFTTIDRMILPHRTLEPNVLELINQCYAFNVTTVSNLDPPNHQRLRGPLNKIFSSRRIAQVEPFVRQVANELVDQLIARGQADLMAEFALPLTIRVISHLLDIPATSIPLIKGYGDAIVAFLLTMVPLDPIQQMKHMQAILACEQYLLDLFAERRAAPGNDILSTLLTMVDSGEADISQTELVTMVAMHILAGGYETSTLAIGDLMHLLLRQRERWEQLLANPDLVPDAIEELLRLFAPSLGFFRVTTTEVQIGGATIPAGAMVLLLYGSANHDERVFTNPTHFDPHRPNLNSHLGFGRGTHYCIGAPLARLEMRVTLEVLMQRLPGIRMTPGQQIRYLPNVALRGPLQFLVEWDTPHTAPTSPVVD